MLRVLVYCNTSVTIASVTIKEKRQREKKKDWALDCDEWLNSTESFISSKQHTKGTNRLMNTSKASCRSTHLVLRRDLNFGVSVFHTIVQPTSHREVATWGCLKKLTDTICSIHCSLYFWYWAWFHYTEIQTIRCTVCVHSPWRLLSDSSHVKKFC